MPRSDLFSFGALLYEMATGKMPFEGSSSGEICGAILHKKPRPVSQLNPQIPLQFEAIIDKALEKNYDLRVLNVLSDSEVAKTLQQMTRPANSKLRPELVRELSQRAGSKAYIAGSIGSLGSEYVLGLKAVNCQNGDRWRRSR